MEEIKIRNFKKDLEESNSIKTEWEKVFKKAFGENSKIEFKDDNVSQIGFGTDATITTKEGRRFSVEYKTRRYDYFKNSIYLLEIAHHRYSDEQCKCKIETVAGWLYKGTFDYVFFGTLNEQKTKIIEVFGFSSIPFKLEEFKSEYNNLSNGWAKTDFGNGIFQLTLNKKVEKDWIQQNAIKNWYWVEE